MTETELKIELQRAYRCIQGMENAMAHSMPMGSSFPHAYHALTIGAAKRYVFDGALDGSQYFEGKQASVLHAALRLPEVNE